METGKTAERIVGFDLARALAVIGMVIVNFKIAMGAADRGPAWLVWLTSRLDGRASATFVILAGIGLSLMTRQARLAGHPGMLAANRTMLFKRALFLFSLGLLYLPIWPADILHFYGVYIALGAWVIGWQPYRLILLATGVGAVFPLLLGWIDYSTGWDWHNLEYADLWTLPGFLRNLLYNGFHPVFPWTAFLLTGLLLGRLDLSAPAVRRRVFIAGLVVVAGAEALSQLLIAWATRAHSLAPDVAQALFGTAPMPPTPLYLLAGGGTACCVIAACVGCGR